MSGTLPGWVWDVIDAAEKFEDEHPPLVRRGDDSGEPWPCLGEQLLGIIPDDVREAAAIHRERIRQIKADVWDQGFQDRYEEEKRCEADPARYFRRDNPYGTPRIPPPP